MKPKTPQEILEYLIENPTKKVGSKHGYFVLGDAYRISGCSEFYKGQLILVEFRFGDRFFSQLNHWNPRWGSRTEDLSKFAQQLSDIGRSNLRKPTSKELVH